MALLDPVTLTAACGFVAVMSGAFLLVMGWRYQATATAGIWGASGIAAAVGLTLFAQDIHIDLGFGGAIAASALSWIALAHFHGRPVPSLPIAAAILAWAIVALVPNGLDLVIRLALHQAVLSALVFGAAFELWRGRTERLAGRTPMLVLLLLHASVFVVGAVMVSVMDVSGEGSLVSLGTFAPAMLEVMLFSIGTSLFLVSMIKERRLNEEKRAAGLDWLTGLPNRGAFFEGAGEAMNAAFGRGAPVAGVLFDLDCFKAINDTYGHALGDAVLQRFAAVLTRSLRSEDLIGRVGGEEFAVLMPSTGREAGLALAERIRIAFAEEGKWVDGQPVKATVSAGIAVAEGPTPLHDLLDAADHALYAAKARGRNRAEVAESALNSNPPAVIRYA